MAFLNSPNTPDALSTSCGICGVALKGVNAIPVEIEVEITGGLFSITVVGLPDTAVKEARERVRAALRNIGIMLKGRIAVNLAPADLPKEGAMLDVPIAVGFLRALGIIPPLAGIFLGELALDGRLRRTRGAVPAALLAKQTGLAAYIPWDNADETSWIGYEKIYAPQTLADLVAHLRGDKILPCVPHAEIPHETFAVDTDLQDIRGQMAAKRALEIAAAGHHNLLFTGSPGSGKTMLARALSGILPPLDDDELTEVLAIKSIAGEDATPSLIRPFRPVHPTASAVALCGGGSSLRPGEVTMAHRGVLFLDEFPEFNREALESLRHPLEDGVIRISRASGSVTYPARVLLVCACNPCPCGYLGDMGQRCTCTPLEVRRYMRKLSGPLLDRIDLHVQVPRLLPKELIGNEQIKCENSDTVSKRVRYARKAQQERWAPLGFHCNAELPEKIVRKNLNPASEVKTFLASALGNLKLTGRGLSRTMKVARTIADLDACAKIEVQHVAEALAFRRTDGD